MMRLQGMKASSRAVVASLRHDRSPVYLVALNDCRFKSTLPPETLERKDTSKPATFVERLKNFPKGFKRLYWDVQRYKNIHDASRTKLNAWTIHKPEEKSPPFIMDDYVRPGKMPRREHEEQRRVKQDLRKVLPVLAIYKIPLVGYIPMILALAAPRQILSRQFHNPYDYHKFASIEYRHRRNYFDELGEHYFNSIMVNVKTLDIAQHQEDAAGPVLDAVPLYSDFSCDTRKLADLETYPSEHLITLALTSSLFQSLPDSMRKVLIHAYPTNRLRQRLRSIANDVATDDALLLEEGYHLHNCDSMTDREVMDACLMRGLPVTVSHAEMRRCLTNHLNMICSLEDSSSKPESLKLFTLHLPALRHYIRQNQL